MGLGHWAFGVEPQLKTIWFIEWLAVKTSDCKDFVTFCEVRWHCQWTVCSQPITAQRASPNIWILFTTQVTEPRIVGETKHHNKQETQICIYDRDGAVSHTRSPESLTLFCVRLTNTMIAVALTAGTQLTVLSQHILWTLLKQHVITVTSCMFIICIFISLILSISINKKFIKILNGFENAFK